MSTSTNSPKSGRDVTTPREGTPSGLPNGELQNSQTSSLEALDAQNSALADALQRALSDGKKAEDTPEADAAGGEVDSGGAGPAGDGTEAPAEKTGPEETGVSPDEPAADAEGREGEISDVTLKDIARRLKISVKRLYSELKIPVGDDGRHMSLEDLKRGYIDSEANALDGRRESLAKEALQVERQRIEVENKTIRSRQEIEAMANALVGVVPDQMLQPLRTMVQGNLTREAGRLFDALPHLKDRAQYSKFLTDAANSMEAYGFSDAEVRNITDSRIYRVINDHMRLLRRVAELEDVSGDPPAAPMSRRTSSKPVKADKKKAAVAKARQTRSERDQIEAAKAILDL